ncbi:MORN motif [Cinara cedri]|uniref:MORN motif n=1 Tax=Cinara cedri TaxID=506608 RepID=A0A5E4M2A3_9HEMI|nr:MORN motif [Cinara cedri]
MTDESKRDYEYVDEYGEFEGHEFVPEEEEDDQFEIDITKRAVAELGAFDGERNSKNQRHGFGKAILPNGDTHEGTYRNDQRHGYGEYKFKNGGRYNGCYKNDLRNGQGVMQYPDKSKYEGHWVDNEKDGNGTFTFSNKDKFSGSWKNNVEHGDGTYSFFKSKVVLKGVWSNGKRVSNFQFYFPTSASSGFTFHGTWDDNENFAGEGYFVFEDSMCMQRGIHVNYNNYGTAGTSGKIGPVWCSNNILPIITGLLPGLPKKKPGLKKSLSSCEKVGEITDPPVIGSVSTSSSRVEMYVLKDDLWTDMDELESCEESDVKQGVNENDIEQL